MGSGRKLGAVEVVYGSVVGGLISSFVLMGVYIAFIEKAGRAFVSEPPVLAVMVGLLSCICLLAAGLYLSERSGWMGTALLFASGFTALWSTAVGSALPQRWMTLLALGVAIAVGVVMGRWRFGAGNGTALPTAGTPFLPGATPVPTAAPVPDSAPVPMPVSGPVPEISALEGPVAEGDSRE
jgi:hypothetical protein